MKSIILMLTLCASAHASHYWTDDQIDQALGLVTSGQVNEASDLVRSWAVTPHDFGIDLLTQGRGIESMYWLQAMSSPTLADGEINQVGHAWVLRALGKTAAARREAEQLLNAADPLARARAQYLVALLCVTDGQRDLARQYANQSRESLVDLGLMGSAGILDKFLQWLSTNKTGMTAPPLVSEWFGDECGC